MFKEKALGCHHQKSKSLGLDDWLRHLDVKIQISLNLEAKEVSLPPFHPSLANQEVINKNG